MLQTQGGEWGVCTLRDGDRIDVYKRQGMSDYTSSALTFNNRHDAPNTTPYFKLDELYKFIATQDGSKVVDDLGFSRVTGAYRLLDLFGYSLSLIHISPGHYMLDLS